MIAEHNTNMISAQDPLRFRCDRIFRRLVDETENRATCRNEFRAKLLSHLIPLFEYLLGKDDENPIDGWFPEDE